VLSYYFGAGVYRGIQRGTIVAAPTDQPAIQAKLSVDLMVRVLEKRHYLRHVSATVILVDSGSLPTFDPSSSLASPGFRPIFSTTE
jgi:protein TorT